MPNPHGTPIWYELLTRYSDRSKAFYDAVVGWSIEPRPAGAMDYRMITDEDGNAGGVMRLTADMTAGGARPGWLMYVAVADVDAAVERACAAGAGTVMAPWTIEGIGRMALLRDPQGAPFYVMRGASGEDSTAFSPVAPRRISWNELATSDQAGAISFYVGLFGWTTAGAMPMGEMGDYTFLTLGELPLGAAMTRRPDGPPPAWTFYVRVVDLDAAHAAIENGGGSVLHGPAAVPGGNRVVIATDPHGATFGLVGN